MNFLNMNKSRSTDVLKYLLSILLFLPAGLRAQILFEDDFEDSTSFSSWTQNTDTVLSIWERGISTNLSSLYWNVPQHSAFIATNDDDCNCNKSKDQILSPVINLGGYDSLLLQFDAFFNGARHDEMLNQAWPWLVEQIALLASRNLIRTEPTDGGE